MRYIDPYEFLQLQVNDPSEVDAALVRRARQRLMAEFELSADGFLKWEGQNLDKATVVRLVDWMEDPEARGHFWRMRTVKGLVPFLKEGKLTSLGQVTDSSITQDLAFCRFCSQFIAPVFEECLTRALSKKQWGDVRMLHYHTALLSDEGGQVAYKGALRFLQDKIIQLEHAAEATGETMKKTAWLSFYESGLIRTLNLLPVQYQQIRNRYAELLGHLALGMNNKANDIQEACRIIEAASQLKVDVGIRTDNDIYLRKLRQVLAAARQGQSDYQGSTTGSTSGNTSGAGNSSSRSQSSSGRSAWGILTLIVGVVIAFARFANSCNRNSSHADYSSLYKNKGFQDYSSNYGSSNGNESERRKARFESLLNNTDHSDKIYHALAAYYERPDLRVPMKAGKRPKTGDSPYSDLLISFSGENTSPIATLHVRNASSKDLVLMVQQSGRLVESRYVRAGATFQELQLPVGNFFFYVFNGNQWCDSIGTIEGKDLGGFLKGEEFIGSINRSEKHPGAEGPRFYMEVAEETRGNHNLTFDGASFKVKK